jgi:hypothetical protein
MRLQCTADACARGHLIVSENDRQFAATVKLDFTHHFAPYTNPLK